MTHFDRTLLRQAGYNGFSAFAGRTATSSAGSSAPLALTRASSSSCARNQSDLLVAVVVTAGGDVHRVVVSGVNEAVGIVDAA